MSTGILERAWRERGMFARRLASLAGAVLIEVVVR
jgi:hypothetical protein